MILGVVHKSNCILVVREEARGSALHVMQVCKEPTVLYNILCSRSCCYILGFGSGSRNIVLLSTTPMEDREYLRGNGRSMLQLGSVALLAC